jgi:hypothetical protein
MSVEAVMAQEYCKGALAFAILWHARKALDVLCPSMRAPRRTCNSGKKPRLFNLGVICYWLTMCQRSPSLLRLFAAALLALPASSESRAADISRNQARSLVISRFGIVATSQTPASQAGAAVLDRGGSAVDAAIAANAVLGVVEPMMNGIGGDLFAIVYEAKTGKLYGLNSSGWSPAAPMPLTARFPAGRFSP